MAYNFLRGDRDQPFLLPPDLLDWLPADHLAWFLLDVVDQLDLGPFYRVHRDDGHGHPAYDPKLLLGVLLYAYAIGVRSSRQIERRCIEDLAFRVLAGNQVPDHVTIARFRVRHQQALCDFLVTSLRLCAAAGLVRLGVVALDGTKVAANAADRANRTLAKLEDEVAQILQEAAEVDQAEGRAHGPARGDELPAELASPSGRLARLRQAKAQLEAEAAERQRRYQQRVAELAAAARAKGKPPRAHIRPRARDEAPNPNAVANTTDPDSRFLHTRNGTVQGYNAQAVVTEHQVVVAAALTRQANDLQQLEPMLEAVDQTLAAAQIQDRPGTVLADSGYWSIANLTTIPDAPELLIWPAATGRTGKPRKDGEPSASRSDGLRAAMFAKLASEDGKACYTKRKQTVEPVFGQLKERQDARRFLRRGLAACDAEWKLLCGTHNLLKLWRATPAAKPRPHRSPPERRSTPPLPPLSNRSLRLRGQTPSPNPSPGSRRLPAPSRPALLATRC
jgi:transposase